MTDKRQQEWLDFLDHLRTAPGRLAPEVRRRVLAGESLDGQLGEFVDTVKRHAYRVTDEQVEQLRSAGYSEDQIFETSVVAAVRAADDRLDTVLRLMREV